jgi:WD40 repeat protein/tRNA A-37 threonylcarbamoyl transferase component Bud32
MIPSPIYCTNCGAPNQAQAKFCFGCGQSLQGVLPASSTSYPTGLLVSNHLLKQRYRILSQAGKGGFAAVYKAEDTLFNNRLVAVKEMSQIGLSQHEIIQASRDFKREALLLASLSHQNLPHIHDHFYESGRWYLVMEFIEGVTLDEYLDNASTQVLHVNVVLDISIQLCNVLDYLHSRQPPIIFRDLKPANSMLTPDGYIYLIDFGIARHFKPGQARDTIAFGSPGYAAPEQYGKAQTTPQADIYSLGSTLHQLLSGNDPSLTPFQFAPLHLDNSSISTELEHLIWQMVELDAHKRPASIKAVARELQRFAAEMKDMKIHTPKSNFFANAVSLSRVSQVSQQPMHQLQTTEDVPPATPLYIYHGHSASVPTVAWSPDDLRIASASHDHTVQVWDAHTGIIIHTFKHRSLVNAVAWSPDGQFIASAGFSGTVHIWEAVSGVNVLTYYGHTGTMGGSVNTLAWSADGKYIASASNDHTVQVWDHSTGQNTYTYHGHAGWFSRVRAMAWSPDNKYIASASNNRTVQVWQDQTGSRDDITRNPTSYEKSVQVWDALTGQCVFTYNKHLDWVTSVAWSPDGSFIASASADKTVQVWDASLSQENSLQQNSLKYTRHNGEVTSVVWSPDEKYIASGSSDMTLQVWHAATGNHFFTYTGHVDKISTVAWSPDGKYIASGSADGIVHIWQAPLHPQEPLQIV